MAMAGPSAQDLAHSGCRGTSSVCDAQPWWGRTGQGVGGGNTTRKTLGSPFNSRRYSKDNGKITGFEQDVLRLAV